MGQILNLDSPDFDGVLQWVLNFRKRLGIPHALKEAGVPEDDAAEVGARAAVDSCASSNPIVFSAQEYQQIFVNALNAHL